MHNQHWIAWRYVGKAASLTCVWFPFQQCGSAAINLLSQYHGVDRKSTKSWQDCIHVRWYTPRILTIHWSSLNKQSAKRNDFFPSPSYFHEELTIPIHLNLAKYYVSFLEEILSSNHGFSVSIPRHLYWYGQKSSQLGPISISLVSITI